MAIIEVDKIFKEKAGRSATSNELAEIGSQLSNKGQAGDTGKEALDVSTIQRYATGVAPATPQYGNPSQDPNFRYDPTKKYDVFGNVIGSNGSTSNGGVSTGGQQTDEYGNILKQRATTQAQSYEDIRKQEQDRIQAQIDAINAQWANEILPDLNQQAQGALGSSRSLQAGGGLLGSARGQAITQNTQASNRRIERAERARIDSQIAMLTDKADQRAIDRADKEATLARQDQDAYFKYLSDQRTEARQDLTTLFQGGVSLDKLKEDPARYQQLLADAGVDDFMAEALYNANAPQEARPDIKYETINDKIVGYYVDQATGQMKTFESEPITGLQTGVKYKNITTPDGTLLFVPEEVDPTRSLDEQIVQYGGQGEWAKPKASSGGGGSSSTVKITATQRNALLSGGFTASESNDVHSYVMENGVYSALSDPGLSQQQKEAISKAYGVSNEPTPSGTDVTKQLQGLKWTPTQIRAYNDYASNASMSVNPTEFSRNIRPDLFSENKKSSSSNSSTMSDEEFIEFLSK